MELVRCHVRELLLRLQSRGVIRTWKNAVLGFVVVWRRMAYGNKGGVFRVRVSGRRDKEPTGAGTGNSFPEAQVEENYEMEPSKYKEC